MISVKVRLDSGECLREITVTGHAGAGTKGNDPVCAAVSALTRTLINALGKEASVSIEEAGEGEGIIAARVSGNIKGRESRIGGITGFFLTGVFDLAAEYPDRVAVTLLQ